MLDWVEQAFSLLGLNWHGKVCEESSLVARKREPYVGDHSHIRRICGWNPSTSFERMVELIVAQCGERA